MNTDSIALPDIIGDCKAKQMKKPNLVILIPAYNEEARIGPTLRTWGQYLQAHYKGEYRIVVVLNGCRDRTLQVVQEAAAEVPKISWTIFEAAIGKGGALIEGLKLAEKADLIGYIDADGSTAPESFLRLVDLCADTDCVVGSRRMPGAVIHQSQPTNRLLASKVFHFIVESFFGMGIRDTQCGAKVMRREAVQAIHPKLHIADMAFDINLLYSLKQAGFRLLEAPVDWTDCLGSTVRYFRTSIVMFMSVVRLRLIYSPFRFVLKWTRSLELRIYRSFRSAPPLAAPTPGVPTVHQHDDKERMSSNPETAM